MSLDGKLYGKGLLHEKRPNVSGVLKKRFLMPPFSVLNARDGMWQKRKRAWLALGIRGEVGRDVKAYHDHEWCREKLGQARAEGGGTSIFDPVICELMYQWFCPPNGQVIDPFAGGSVRGIVAGVLGRKYWGCDLRQEQIDANNEQAKQIIPDNHPEWVCGDADAYLSTAPDADFIFSCPPYGDLEVYCDDPRDLSNMEWSGFKKAYQAIIGKACDRLREDRFACFVVGDFRDKKGCYRNFVSGTIASFLKAGMRLYNEIILVTAVGSLPVRVGKQFETSRKVGKTHQNVLVFVKGDPKRATEAITKGKRDESKP